MEHLENHPQAFVDADGNVLNVAIFADHDADLIASIASGDYRVVEVVDCCEHGEASVGYTWDGTAFAAPLVELPAEEVPAEETTTEPAADAVAPTTE